ncbi:MAG: glycoside hydrolase [Planctomycetes bacterium GWF2_50_10]|nr:MAG: glycoside hydrolase [Planctomycetes bacterium GWF2_50_10]
MDRYVCIHGHFYQPPRENPWLEEVELEDSAYPYHDWNARITADAYGPNGASRILDSQRRILDIVNNYAKMSFNFGPTLLSWMERHSPEVYQAIIEADKLSAKRYSGHGSAIAQAYNHMIMPLANARDKCTQVRWGIADFKYRFGRDPEGMWLPETAADMETLDVLAEHGIKFTILSPRQAWQVRKAGDGNWQEVRNASIDPKRVYNCMLPSGKSIAIFFYDGPISASVGYGGLLHSGENFANRLAGAFTLPDSQAQIVSIATDGETFGHHHRHGDMALAYCMHYIESKNLAKLTNYGEYLEKCPPQWEVKIHDNSSWSCVHGVERWRSNCGCSSGGHPGWSQQWRVGLREGMDFLRDSLTPLYEQEMEGFVSDPWQVRDEYVDVILDRRVQKVNEFLAAKAGRGLAEMEKNRMLKLLEIQRHAMLMYTSCGWFFDEISGIEGVQVMLYAGRAIQLAREVLGVDLEEQYKAILEKSKSNSKRVANGREAYELYIEPAEIDLHRVGAHYAVSSLFGQYPTSSQVYCYTTINEIFERWEAGTQTLVVGRARMRSVITLDEYIIDFAVLHLGEHNIYGGVGARLDDVAFANMNTEMKTAFHRSDISGVIRILNVYFGTHNYSLWYLFKDEQRKVINEIFRASLQEVEGVFRHIYEHHYPLMQAMREMLMPLPKALSTPAEFIINSDFTEELEKEEFDIHKLQNLVAEVRKWSFELDKGKLGYVASGKINNLMRRVYLNPQDTPVLEKLEAVLRILKPLPQELDLWKAQNMCFELRKNYYESTKQRAQQGSEDARKWLENFNKVAEYLEVKVG